MIKFTCSVTGSCQIHTGPRIWNGDGSKTGVLRILMVGKNQMNRLLRRQLRSSNRMNNAVPWHPSEVLWCFKHITAIINPSFTLHKHHAPCLDNCWKVSNKLSERKFLFYSNVGIVDSHVFVGSIYRHQELQYYNVHIKLDEISQWWRQSTSSSAIPRQIDQWFVALEEILMTPGHLWRASKTRLHC